MDFEHEQKIRFFLSHNINNALVDPIDNYVQANHKKWKTEKSEEFFEFIGERTQKYDKNFFETNQKNLKELELEYSTENMNQNFQVLSHLKYLLPKLQTLKINLYDLNSVSCFKNAFKNIIFLEISFSQYLSDLSNLGSLENAEVLNLSYNKIQDISGLHKNMPKVKVLKLGYNQIKDVSALKNSMPQVEQLFLNNNKITNVNGLKNSMPKVKCLNLSKNKIRGIAGLKNSMPNVLDLNLSTNSFRDIKNLENSMPRVLKLDLSWCKIEDYTPLIGNISNVEKLELYFKSVDRSEPPQFENLQLILHQMEYYYVYGKI